MSTTLSLAQRFPAKSQVKVFADDAWLTHERPPSGPPPAGAKPVVTTKVRKDGTVSLSKGIKTGRQYFAYGEVDGEHRYVSFFGG